MENSPYAPPKAEIANDQPGINTDLARQQHKILTASFLTYVGSIVVFIAASVGKVHGLALLALISFLLSAIAYYVFLCLLARTNGKSAVVWGGLTFLTSPFGIFVSYAAMRGVGRKNGWR